MRTLLDTLRKILRSREGGGKALQQVAQAYGAIARAMRGEETSREADAALMRVLAGALPKWKGNDRGHKRETEKRVIATILKLQEIGMQAIGKWKYESMEGREWERQRYKAHGWMRLALHTWNEEAQRAKKAQGTRGKETGDNETEGEKRRRVIGCIGSSKRRKDSSETNGSRGCKRPRRERCAVDAERAESRNERDKRKPVDGDEDEQEHARERVDWDASSIANRPQRKRYATRAAVQNEQPMSSTQQHERGVEAEEDRDRDGDNHDCRSVRANRRMPDDQDEKSSSSSTRKGAHKQSTANCNGSTSTGHCNDSNRGDSRGREDLSAAGSGGDGGGSGSDGSTSDRSSQRGADHIGVRRSITVPAPVPVPIGSMPLSNVENCNETQLRVRAILTYMRLISRPKSIRQRVREGLLRWVKVRAEEVNQQKRVDELRESRGEAPSASTRHSSTTFKPAPKILKRKEVIRENKGQTQTRTKIGKRIAVINERMGAISKRIAQREKRGDG